MEKEKLPQLSQMTSQDKDSLIYRLWEENQRLKEELEKYREKETAKTSKNSSKPPSTDQKGNINNKSKKKKKKAHNLGGRKITPNPDRIIKVYAERCSHCGEQVSKEKQKLQACYEKIEIPPIKPIVTQIRRYGGLCNCCHHKYEAIGEASLAQGSPFGETVRERIIYLRYAHAISYERLRELMEQIYGVKISEGAIANLLKRTKNELEPTIVSIIEKLRASEQVNSDETSARVRGKNEWEWVFQNREVCYHVIEPSRGGKVIQQVMAGHEPSVWGSDLFSAQKTHPGQSWQVCLAHQIRDCQYAIDKGDQILAPVMQKLFLRAIELQRRRDTLTSSTYEHQSRQIKRDLKQALQLNPSQDDGKRLRKRYQNIEENLFLFLDNPEIEPTNNASEQALRFSVIFRKVTNGFRSDWGKELFAYIRSIINTGKRQGLSALESIRVALDPRLSLFCPS